jgi:septal ring factor EnvC (AmiA/AmiB activator)
MDVMSEKDFIKKLWQSVAAGVLIMIITSVATSVLTARQTDERSKRNEQCINELQQTTVKKGDSNNIHQTLIDQIQKNEARIDAIETEQDENFKYLIDKLDKINQNILELHQKK